MGGSWRDESGEDEKRGGSLQETSDWIGPRKGRTLVVGLTGGIGSGKSTVARMLQSRGAAVIDADAYAREVVAPGEPALAEIERRFGEGVITGDGRLDRAALAGLVFDDPKAREDLEAIVHPRIAAKARETFQRLQEEGVPVVVYEAALIVEKRLHHGMDGLIVVSVSPKTQVERVLARDGSSEQEVRARLMAQLPLAEKIAEADWVVDNGGGLEETEARVDAIWREIRHAATEEPTGG